MEQESERVRETGTALERISQVAEHSARLVEGISRSTNDQVLATQELVRAMQRISEVSHQTLGADHPLASRTQGPGPMVRALAGPGGDRVAGGFVPSHEESHATPSPHGAASQARAPGERDRTMSQTLNDTSPGAGIPRRSVHGALRALADRLGGGSGLPCASSRPASESSSSGASSSDEGWDSLRGRSSGSAS